MATRDYLKHFVSNTQPTNAAIGDEWYNPVTNLFYKNVALNGTTPTFNPISSSLVIQSSGTTLNSNTSNINFVGFTMSADSTGAITINPPSAAAGGLNTYVQYNNSNALGGSANFTWNNSTQTLALTGFLTTYALSRSGGINSATWTTTSPMFNSAAALLTDTTGSGTIALKAGHSFLSPNFASTSGTTITDAANVYINANVAGANTTITNNWSLYVAGNQRVTGTLYVDGNVQLSGSKVVDYKNSTAQWSISGGGLVTWTGASVLWGTRVLVIPVANSIMGSAGHFEIACPTSGTVVYYNSANVTTTVTATTAGIPLAAYEALYYEVTEGQSNASDQTKFRVVNYLNTTWRPGNGWLLIAVHNGEGTNLGHLKWLPGQINLPNNGSTVTYNVGTGAVTGFNAGGALQSLTMNNGGAGATSGTTFNGGTAQTISYNTIGAAASNQTMYIGTTAVAINRASATGHSLAGVSIDGSSATFTSTAQNSQFNSIGVNVAASASAGTILIESGVLGQVSGNVSSNNIRLQGNNGNSSYLDTFLIRDSAGTTWTTAATRIQQKVDSTWMAYQQFNGTNVNGGIEWGTGTSTTSAASISARMRLDSSGILRLITNTGSTSTTTGTLVVTGGVGVSENVYVGGWSQHVSLGRTNARFAQAEMTPVGHYTPGETVFEIDPTWSQVELQKYFNSTGVTWLNDTTSPGGYCIQMDGAINFGSRAYGGGFPMIPIETNDIYYMEMWLKNDAAYAGPGHYVGGVSMDAAGTVLPGNPGSYDYFLMSNTAASTSWVKYGAYITGFAAAGSAAGTWPTNAKYWSPLMLANYSFASGTRRSYMSGWRVYKVYQTGRRKHADMVAFSVADTLTSAGSTQGTALVLTSDVNNITTAAASTGVILTYWQSGHKIMIRNSGANAINVFPNSGAQINSLGTNVAFVLGTGTLLEFIAINSTQWYTTNATFSA